MTAAFVNLGKSHHKIKSQNNLELPNGVPNYMFYFPEPYAGTQNGIQVANSVVARSIHSIGSQLTTGVLHLTSWMKSF